jgi:hypothetical protein
VKNPLATQEMVRHLARRRRWWRRTRWTLVAVGAVVLVGGLAYGVDRLAPVCHRLYVKYIEHGHGTPVAAPTSVSTTTSTAPGPPDCVTPQLNAYLDHWQIVAATLYEIIVVTNTSETPCSLVGYPGLGASGPNGAELPAPVGDVATLGGVTGASALTPVVLDTGSLAWFEASYSVACSVVLSPGEVATGVRNACFEGTDLQVVAPHAADALLVTQPLRFTFGTDGFQVGPFQGGPLPSSPPLG